jgi:hypothetical protein
LQEIESLLRHFVIIPRRCERRPRAKARANLEEARLAAGLFAIEIFVGAGRRYSAAGGAVDHADLHQVGLVHFFDGVFFFAEGGG